MKLKKSALILMIIGGVLVISGFFSFGYSLKGTYELTEEQIEEAVQSAPPFTGANEIYAKAKENIKAKARKSGLILTGVGLAVFFAGLGFFKFEKRNSKN